MQCHETERALERTVVTVTPRVTALDAAEPHA